MIWRLALAASLAALPAACRPIEEPPGPPGGAAYSAPPAQPRRNLQPSPDVHRWLEASSSVRLQLSSLRAELATLQQLHVENHFDDFLALDPASLEPGPLCYLQHFLDRGYFRIEREILLQLLSSRQARAAASLSPPPTDLPARLQAALQRDETLLIDLEAAIARYRAPGDDPFLIPAILTEAALAEQRQQVASQLAAERLYLKDLDQRIAALQPHP